MTRGRRVNERVTRGRRVNERATRGRRVNERATRGRRLNERATRGRRVNERATREWTTDDGRRTTDDDPRLERHVDGVVLALVLPHVLKMTRACSQSRLCLPTRFEHTRLHSSVS